MLYAMKYIFANWKMYLDFDESCVLTHQLTHEAYDETKIQLGLFPTYLAIPEAVKMAQGTRVHVGAQNCAWTPKGAYTGAVSALLLKSVGCRYVLVGHSERRYIFGESSDDVRKKIEACFDVGLTPILCIGETEKDSIEGKREYRLRKQLFKALDGLDLTNREIIVAYEPVWAISSSGTGKTCHPADADDVHGWIRLELRQYSDRSIPILYGGSVDAENVVSYVSLDTVDGVLVGGASYKYDTFFPLIRAVEGQG